MTSSLPVAIPDQLKGRGLRFTRLRPAILGDRNSGKRPTDKRFYDEGALREDDPSLSSHLEAGLGFGMVCNFGDLIGFDADQGELLEEMGVMARLPATLTDRAPHKPESLHLYCICKGLPRTFHFWHPSILAPEEEDEEGHIQPRKRLELGQICAGRGHITGPGAPHWSGGRREIIDDSPLTEISIEDLKKILEGVAFSDDPTKNPTFEEAAELVDTSSWDRLRSIENEARKARRGRGDDLSLSERIGDIRRVLSAYSWNPTVTSGDNWKGPHPREYSKSNTALVVEVKKGLWHCKHHDPSGGDAASLVALFEGLITCEEHHKLRDKDLFLKVVKACEERGLISPSDREPKATTSATGGREKSGDLFPLSSGDVLKAVKFDDATGEPTAWKFSPARAAASFQRVIPLKMASWDPKSIWWCDLGIWRPDGDRLLAGLCDDLGDELSNGYQISEVLRRLRVKLGWDKVDFDVAKPYLIATKNGYTIDLRTGDARPIHPDDLISMPINANYDPSARCPVFVGFLKGSCGNDTDRLTLCDHLASCAIAMEIEYILFLLGHGSNGKKIFEAFMLDFFGFGSGEAIGLEELTKSRFAVSFLMRARFSIGTETNPTGTETEMMKRISGGDWISGDIKNVHERARFRPFTQLMYDSNAMPVIEDNSAGWQRRFVGVSMPFRFVDHPNENDPLQKKADRHLLEKLATEEEKSGVLNLMIERARVVWEKRQITRREDDATTYNRQSFSVRDFIDQFIDFYPNNRDDYQESAGLLFDRFEEYARYTVGATVTRQKFSLIIGKANGKPSEKITVDKLDVRGFKGLQFNQPAFDRFISQLKGEYSRTTGNDVERPENDLKIDSCNDDRTSRTIFSIFNDIVYRYGSNGGNIEENDSKRTESFQGRSTRSTRSPVPQDIDFGKNKVVLKSFSENDHDDAAEDEGGELAGDSEPSDDYQPIAEEMEEADKKEAEHSEKFKTPEEGRLPTAEESEVLEDLAGRILENWPGLPEMLLWEKARGKLGSRLPLAVVRHWLSESGYTATGEKYGGGVIWNLPTSEEAVA